MSTELSTEVQQTELAAAFGAGPTPQLPVDAPLPTIQISRETAQFMMPDGEMLKSFTGHIIYYHNANQLFLTEYGAEGAGIPDCLSSDGIKPDGGNDPGPFKKVEDSVDEDGFMSGNEVIKCEGGCGNCYYNQYGSDLKGGNGKACQNTMRIYVLVDGDILPCLLKAPPSSLSPKESMMRWLTAAPNTASKAGWGYAYQPIKVKFTLNRKDFKGSGMSAAVLHLETDRVLEAGPDTDLIKKLGAMTQDFHKNYAGRVAGDMAAESTDDVPF